MSRAERKAALSANSHFQMSRSSTYCSSAGMGAWRGKNSHASRAPDLFMSKCTTPQRQAKPVSFSAALLWWSSMTSLAARSSMAAITSLANEKSRM